MHKMMEFVCKELEDLERKADKDGKLSMAEVQYADMLTNMKKNMLKADEMMGEDEFSMAGGSYNDGSYARSYRGSYARGGNRGGRGGSYGNSYDDMSYARGRGRKRDSMGRYSSEGYSRDSEEMVEQLRDLMEDAPDEMTRKEFEKFIRKVEQM